MNDIVGRLVTSIMLMVLAAIIMLAGLGFLFAALFMTLTEYTSPEAAAAAVGLAAFLVALVLILLARRRRPRRRYALRPQQALGATSSGQLEADAAALGLRLADEGGRLARSHAKGAAVTALCAGLVVGISPRLRRALWRSLR